MTSIQPIRGEQSVGQIVNRQTQGPLPPLLFGTATDTVSIRFGAKHPVDFPNTPAASRWSNGWVQMDKAKLTSELVIALDEIMTTTGEAYAKDADRLKEGKRAEAFTTLLDVSFNHNHMPAKSAGMLDASTAAQVDHTYTVTIPANPAKGRAGMAIGNMVIGSEARDYDTGNLLASSRATFVAVDSDSVKAGKNQPVGVRELTVKTPLETQGQSAASGWEKGLRDFYSAVKKRVNTSGHPNLAQVQESSTRSVTSNMYVKTNMLNKKHTGHGGVTAAMALDHMQALGRRYLNAHGLRSDAVRVEAFTADFAAPYKETDALQFDTTLDHVSPKGEMIFSTRISKHDTQGGTVEGPVFMVHAKLTSHPKSRMFRSFLSHEPIPMLKKEALGTEEKARQEDAVNWLALRNL